MAGQILCTPETLREYAGHLATHAAAAEAAHAATMSRLSDLGGVFRGDALAMFTARLDEWYAISTEHVEALRALRVFLDQAAEVIEQTDAQLASGLD